MSKKKVLCPKCKENKLYSIMNKRINPVLGINFVHWDCPVCGHSFGRMK